MGYIVLFVGAVIAYFVFAHFSGRPEFWKLTRLHPREALRFFEEEDCWHVFMEKPPEGYKTHLPGRGADWQGPFKFQHPDTDNLITLFCEASKIEASQTRFIEMMRRAF